MGAGKRFPFFPASLGMGMENHAGEYLWVSVSHTKREIMGEVKVFFGHISLKFLKSSTVSVLFFICNNHSFSMKETACSSRVTAEHLTKGPFTKMLERFQKTN